MIGGLGKSTSGGQIQAPPSSHRDVNWYRTAGKSSSEIAVEPVVDDGAVGDVAWSAVSLITSGIILYGGIGWLVGRWVGNQSAFAAAGVIVGVALSTFMIYRRLGSQTKSRKD
jgi:hypothetical protein